jgi:chromosome segregation ATPase
VVESVSKTEVATSETTVTPVVEIAEDKKAIVPVSPGTESVSKTEVVTSTKLTNEGSETGFLSTNTSSQPTDSVKNPVSSVAADQPSSEITLTESSTKTNTNQSTLETTNAQNPVILPNIEITQSNLNIPTTNSLSNLTPGVWTVGKTGQVSFDFLVDAGLYEGEIAIVNLSGMEQYPLNSDAFKQEAIQRALSNSELGYIAIRDRLEGARFSGEFGEPNVNIGPYQGVKTFAMTPGSKFVLMLVPNATVKEISESPSLWADKTPLFSIPAANSDGKGMLADFTGKGNTFGWEDIPGNQADRDFNDLIFAIEGATANVPEIAENVNANTQWLESKAAQELLTKALLNDKPPAIKLVADVALTPAQPTRTIDLTQVFVDPESSALKYEVVEGNSPSLAVSLQGNNLQLTGLPQSGVTDVVIRATDVAGNSVIHNFAVTTSNLPREFVADINNALTDFTKVLNQNSQIFSEALSTDAAADSLANLAALLEQYPDAISLFNKPDSLAKLGITESNLPTIKQLLQSPEVAAEFGLSVSLGEALSHPDSADFDEFLLNADEAIFMLPSDAQQPKVGFIDFTEGQHLQRVTSVFSSINSLANYDTFMVDRGNWAEQLMQFVDGVKAKGENRAIANLSFDLSQLDDIGITTRYELTPEEQTAIQYARENNVLLVVAAGNTGGVMSALGAASKQFDNIITVGAVNQFESKTDYSAYGEGLDLMAPGGSWAKDANAFVGTSRSASYVTAAASLVWATNPALSLTQVKQLLIDTAADLNTPGWDKETGAGLVDVKSAIDRALSLEPKPPEPVKHGLQVSLFSGEWRVETLARAASEATQKAILDLEKAQEDLLEQWQNLADLGNPSLTLSDLQADAVQKIADALNNYREVSTKAGITDAHHQQRVEELALATSHYLIENDRLQQLLAQRKELEERLAKLGKDKSALEAETQKLLESIQAQIAKAETDFAKAQAKLLNPFANVGDNLQIDPAPWRQAANKQQEFASNFQEQAAIQSAEAARFSAISSNINPARWQPVGSEKGRGISGRSREVWGWGNDPNLLKQKNQSQWQAQIATENSQSLKQLSQQATQQQTALNDYAQFIEERPTNLGEDGIEKADKVVQILEAQAVQQAKIAENYANLAAIAASRQQQNQAQANLHNSQINRQEQVGTKRTGRSGSKTEPVYGNVYYPEHIAPRDMAQQLANQAAAESQAYGQLAKQAEQQASALKEQARKLKTNIKDWPVLKQGIDYEIAADALRLQAEKDLLALHDPVQRQKLETLLQEIALAQKELQRLENEKIPAQQQLTDATENRLKASQAKLEAIQAEKAEAAKNLQNFLETAGFLLPYRERLLAVDKQIEKLESERLDAFKTILELQNQLQKNPSDSLQQQLNNWRNYLQNLEQELTWAKLQRDQLAMALADSPERLAIAALIKQLETAPASLNPQAKIAFLKSIEGSGANFLAGFDNLNNRLTQGKTEQAQTEKSLAAFHKEYRELGLKKANLEDVQIPAKQKQIVDKYKEIEGTESAIAQTKSNLSTISAAQLTDIPSAIASTDTAIQQQKSAVQGYQNQISQAFAAANSLEQQRQANQNAANYWNSQIYVFNADAYLAYNPDVAKAFGWNPKLAYQHYLSYGRYEGRLPNPQAAVYRNNHQATANYLAQQRDLATSNAQQLNATLQPQIATAQKQISTLETDRKLLVQLSQLNTQLSQQQQQRDNLVKDLEKLNQQKADTEQKLIDKYREIEFTSQYLEQVEGEVDRLQSRLDVLNRTGVLQTKYQQDWNAWQQANQTQLTATESLLATRQSGAGDRQQLADLQSQLKPAQENLQKGRSLKTSLADTQQALAFTNLQIGNQNLVIQSAIDNDPGLAATERSYLNLADASRQKTWYWNGSAWAYNAGEAAAARSYLQAASFIADERNKLWQRRQDAAKKINELTQKVAEQQSQIASLSSQLQALGGMTQLEADFNTVQSAIASVNQRLQPLQTRENQLIQTIKNAASQAANLAAEMAQTTQLKSTSLRQLIGLGMLASESDVDFFATQVDPQVNTHLEKLRGQGQDLTNQINSINDLVTNWEQQLANTTDPEEQEYLKSSIELSKSQISSLEALKASSLTAADDLEKLLKQATDALLPLRQKQELEIRQKLESNENRLNALQSQLNSENAAEAAIKDDTVLAYAQLSDRVRDDLTNSVNNSTKALLEGNPMTKELGDNQQQLSRSVDTLIAEINDRFADPYGEYQRSEANLEDGIKTLGVVENRADALDDSVTSTEEAIERIKLRIKQDEELWQEIAPIAMRYGVESQELKDYQQQYQAILEAKSPKLAQAQTLLTNAESLQKQAASESNRSTILTQQITALKNTLPTQIRNLLEQSNQINNVQGISPFGQKLNINLANQLTSILKAYPYADIINQINSLQQQVQAAQNQSSALTQQATNLQKQADILKEQANDDVNAEVKTLRSKFLEEHPDNGTAIDLLKGSTLEGRSPNQHISKLLNSTVDELLAAEAVEGRNPNQALFDKAKAEQASHEAQGYAALAYANWLEQRAAYHWSVSRKNGPYWYEQRWVKRRSGKGYWETVTHVDHDWILWNNYSQLFPQVRQQGIAHLVEADKWRKEKERIEPLAKQWTDANNAANQAQPPVKEARDFFAQLEEARKSIPGDKIQLELLENLLPTLKQQLEQAESEAAAQNAKVQQQWEEYDTNSEEYRAAVADILERRGELNKQAIETQQEIAESEKWVERQSVALSAELAGTKALIDSLKQQQQAITNQIAKFVQQGATVDGLQDLYSKEAQLKQTLQLVTNKAAILTAQQTTLTQKRTLLTAQNEVILAEQRLLDSYTKDPDADTSNLQQQLQDARAALAEAQRLAEQAEAASKILTAPLQQLKEDLLVQNDEHLKQARENQQILKALVEATQANANYTIQAAQKQQEVNNLEFQILQRLQAATAAGFQEAKALLDVAKHNDMATAAEIYYRDYSDLASDRGSKSSPGLAQPQDRILADRYYQEMLNNRELQRRAQAQADAFGAARKTAEAQMKTLQAQQETAAKILSDLNDKIATTQEEREKKEQELAIAQARLDGITRIREQTEQTFIQLVTIEKLNLAQAQLEQEIAESRQKGIDEAVQARMERDRVETARQRTETVAKIELLRQLQAEDNLRQSLNEARGNLGMTTLEATDDPVQLQTKLAGLLASLKDLETQQESDLPADLKALLAEARGDIHEALQGKEAANIQENLLKAMDGLIGQIQQYKTEINRIDLEEQWDTQLLQTAQTDLQGASQQLLKELQRAEELSGEKQVIEPLYMEALTKVAYAEQAVGISEDLAKQSKEMLEQIIKQRVAERKARKKAFWNKILGIVSTVLSLVGAVLTFVPGANLVGLALGAIGGAINVVQAAINGDWMGAIFSAVMAGASFIGGAIGNGIKAGQAMVMGMAKAVAQKVLTTIKVFQSLASGAFNGVRNILSGDKIMGFLQIMGGLAGAATSGISGFVQGGLSGLSDIGKFGYKVLESLSKAPTLIYGGIKAIQSGDWVSGIGNMIKGVISLGKTWTNDFNDGNESPGEKIANILENVSSVGIGVSKFITGGLEGLLAGLGDILDGLGDDIQKWVDNLVAGGNCDCPCPCPEEDISKVAELMSEEIRHLSSAQGLAMIENLSPEVQAEILSRLSFEQRADIFSELPLDKEVEVIKNLPPEMVSDVVLESVKKTIISNSALSASEIANLNKKNNAEEVISYYNQTIYQKLVNPQNSEPDLIDLNNLTTTKTKYVADDNGIFHLQAERTLHPAIDKIVNEMTINQHSKDVLIMQKLNGLANATDEVANGLDDSYKFLLMKEISLGLKASAYLVWTDKVLPGHEWDHKLIMKEADAAYNYENNYYLPISTTKMEKYPFYTKTVYIDNQGNTKVYDHDVWSNIHYGYIGRAAGFSENELLNGAGVAQLKTIFAQWGNINKSNPDANWEDIFKNQNWKSIDAVRDQNSIKFGFNLYDDYLLKGKDLTINNFTDELNTTHLLEWEAYK